MAKVEEPLQEPPPEVLQPEALGSYLEDLRRKANSIGDAVADIAIATADASITTTETADGVYSSNEQDMLNNLKADVTDLKDQLNSLLAELKGTGLQTSINALLDELRDAGMIARS